MERSPLMGKHGSNNYKLSKQEKEMKKDKQRNPTW